MSNISVLYTPHATQHHNAQAKSQAGATTGSSLAANQAALGGGGSFLDVLFAALSSAAPLSDAGTALDQNAQTTTDAKAQKDAQDGLESLTNAQDIKTSDDALKALQNQLLLMAQHQGKIDDAQAAQDIQTLDDLRTKLLDINAAARENATDALSKADMQALMAKMQAIQNGTVADSQGTDTPFTHLAVMQLVAPKTQNAKSPIPDVTTGVSKSSDATAKNTLSDQELAARLNAINVGGDEKSEKGDKTGHGLPDWLSTLLAGKANDAMNYVPPSQGQNSGISLLSGHPTGDKTKMMIDSVLGFFGVTPSSASSDPSLTVDTTSLSPETVTGYAQNLIQNHPASSGISPAAQANLTHAVAMQLQNMAGNRETRSLTIQINPPELGKMQVKMSYGRDKTVKADIAVEKADTLSLLQKDEGTLREAMQQAGLHADAGSLSFSLADQGAFSNQTNEGSSARLDTPVNDNDMDLAEIQIRSSEEWSVDPKTGITRYNIYV